MRDLTKVELRALAYRGFEKRAGKWAAVAGLGILGIVLILGLVGTVFQRADYTSELKYDITHPGVLTLENGRAYFNDVLLEKEKTQAEVKLSEQSNAASVMYQAFAFFVLITAVLILLAYYVASGSEYVKRYLYYMAKNKELPAYASDLKEIPKEDSEG